MPLLYYIFIKPWKQKRSRTSVGVRFRPVTILQTICPRSFILGIGSGSLPHLSYRIIIDINIHYINLSFSTMGIFFMKWEPTQACTFYKFKIEVALPHPISSFKALSPLTAVCPSATVFSAKSMSFPVLPLTLVHAPTKKTRSKNNGTFSHAYHHHIITISPLF